MGRRFPVGAEIVPGGVHFRVWAPLRKRVAVELDGRRVALGAEPGGYFSGRVDGLGAGARYRYALDDAGSFPDPASRWQPEGPHGPSEVIDPAAYRWDEGGWRGAELRGQVLYELHVGTFTPEGTYEAAARELPELAALGVTAIELMPLADFPGRFGWGYDGVALYAPYHGYGTPDDLRRLVERAHRLGLAVILDVVYNHLGPDGNYTGRYADGYVSKRHAGEWGDAINFDEPGAGPVRELISENAAYWIEEYRMDGLRLDATQNVHDDGPDHVLGCIGRRVRAAARGRATILVAENEPQHTRLVRPLEAGGYGLDGLWNDDFHHTARVAATGRAEAYYQDYGGTPQELVSAVKRGYVYQGQWYAWQNKPRGTSTAGLEPWRMVHYLENHDQVANAAHGARLRQLTTPGRYRALVALHLLAPGTPLLFQGQELGSTAPFLYFADHEPGLAAVVKKGRFEFLAQFPSLGGAKAQARLADPGDPATFRACQLDRSAKDPELWALHLDLLRLRREDPAFNAQEAGVVDGAVLGAEAFVLRFTPRRGDERLLLVNLGHDLALARMPEPLLAPPAGRRWDVLWSSEDPRYGGGGSPPLERGGAWLLPGHAALVLLPATRAETP